MALERRADASACFLWYFGSPHMNMTTLAGGFLVTNYHNAERKVSKSNLDQGRKQKRPLRQTRTAVDALHGLSLKFSFCIFQTKQLRNQFHSALEKGLKIRSSHRS